MGRYSEVFQLQPNPFDASGGGKTALRICLFVDVKNADQLLEAVRRDEIPGSLIKAELVYSVFHLLAGANRALYARARNELRTRNVHTELLFALSPTMNITQSLQRFGIDKQTKHVLVAIFDDTSGALLTKVLKVIKGTPVPLSDLKKVADLNLIREVYSLRRPELNYESYDDEIVSIIVSKEFVSH